MAQQKLDEIEPAARFAEYQLKKHSKTAAEPGVPASPTTPNIRVRPLRGIVGMSTVKNFCTDACSIISFDRGPLMKWIHIGSNSSSHFNTLDGLIQL